MPARKTRTGLDDLVDRVEALSTRGNVSLSIDFLQHQKPVFESGHKHICLAKGRRWGGTHGAVIKLIKMLLRNPALRILWVDTSYAAIKRYWQRYWRPALHGLPSALWTDRFNADSQILWQGGGYIDFASAERPELMEGQAYDIILINEAGIVLQNPSLYYNTLLPMGIEGQGAAWYLVGTPKGRGLFYSLYLDALDDPEWIAVQKPSDENPLLSLRELERLRRMMPAGVQAQELQAEFVDDDQSVFLGVENIMGGEPLLEGEPGRQYVIGVDVAKSQDFTVVWVGDIQSRRGVYVDRFNRMPWPDAIERIGQTARRFWNAQIYLDATGLGSVVLDDMRAKGLNVTPVIFNTGEVKGALINRLSADIEQQRLGIIPHEQTERELKQYRRTRLPSGAFRYDAPRGEHDDCVIALALMAYGFGSHSGMELLTTPGVGAAWDSNSPIWSDLEDRDDLEHMLMS